MLKNDKINVNKKMKLSINKDISISWKILFLAF